MRIVPGKPQHAKGILQVRRVVRADTYAGHPPELTREYLLRRNAVTEQRIRREEQMLGDSRFKYWVGEENGEVKGYLRLSTKSRQAINYIHILPDYQGQGLGNRFLEQALAYFDRAQPAYLEVAEGNTRALQWYQRHGWQLTGKVVKGTPLPGGEGFVREYVMVLLPRQ